MADLHLRELDNVVVCRGHCIATRAAVNRRHLVLDRMDAFRKLYVLRFYCVGFFTSFSGTLAVIMMQMFIAVINENFDIAEEAKKGRQASHYWASQRQERTQVSWMKKLNPYRWFAPAPKAIAVDNLPSGLVLPMQKALVQDYSVPKRELSAKVHSMQTRSRTFTDRLQVSAEGKKAAGHYPSRSLKLLQSFFVGEQPISEIPLTNLKNLRRDSAAHSDPNDDEMGSHL